MKTKTRSVCFDTLFRENYEESLSTDFKLILKEPLDKVVSMKLSALELPNRWYSISNKKKNNRFRIKLYNFYQKDTNNIKYLVHERKHEIIIPDGNYHADNFQDTLNTIFTNTRGGLEFLIVEISEISTKTIIRCRSETDMNSNPNPNPNPYDINSDIYSPSFSYKISFYQDDFPLYQTLGWMMGYREMKYIVGYNDIFTTRTTINQKNEKTIYRGYLLSESSYSSSIYQYVYFIVDENKYSLRKENIFSEMKEISENILARVVVSSGNNITIINNSNSNNITELVFKKREYKAPIKIENFHFAILDKFGVVIDLNKNDYSFMLEFTMMDD